MKYAPIFHTWNIKNSSFMYEMSPIFSHMKYRKFYYHIWKSAPIFSYMKFKKSIFHIWNMHLYYHTWNIENSIFIHEVCTWLGPLFRPWNLGSHGFNGWTVMDLKRPDRVPLIKWPVTSTVWFNLAGTTVPSAPRGWYPDPLALRTLEK